MLYIADIPAQLAAVTVERKGQVVEMTAAVVKDLKYDMLLGTSGSRSGESAVGWCSNNLSPSLWWQVTDI